MKQYGGRIEVKIEQEIKAIKDRNIRVEADKAWEMSLFRKVLITIFTYVIISIVFYLIGVKSFLLNALIPTTGYFLSVQTIPFVKNWWTRKYMEKK